MKNKILTILLFLLPVVLFSQNVKLSGDVFGYEVRQVKSKDNKLYFTYNGKAFNNLNYIIYSSDFKYEWSLSINKIKSDGIKELIFSTDTLTDPKDKNACVHRIKLDEILTNMRFDNENGVNINCDLLLDFNCELSAYYGAEEDGLGRFVGSYKMIDSTTVHYVSLKDFAFRYLSTSTNKKEDMLTEEYGSWQFNPTTNILTFNVWIKRNHTLGLMKKTKYQYNFEVIQRGDTLSFKSNNYKLFKLN